MAEEKRKPGRPPGSKNKTSSSSEKSSSASGKSSKKIRGAKTGKNPGKA